MKAIPLFVVLLGLQATLAIAQAAPVSLLDPYARTDNGPPLAKVFDKAKPAWIYRKLREPRHHPAARMPDFKFTEDEVLDLMAHLKSLASAPPPATTWPVWAEKSLDDMEDDLEIDAALQAMEKGKGVWNQARCSICHTINGPGGKLVGGFVDLRVGGIDLQIAATKLRRDWLFNWLKEPKTHFPNTLMPRARFTDAEIKSLVEHMLRDDAFLPPEEETAEQPVDWKVLASPERRARGRRLMETARCTVCHDVSDQPVLYEKPRFEPPRDKTGFGHLVYDLRCLSCHSIGGRGGTYAPDLSAAGSRLQESWIAKFVETPDPIRPLSQQMPKLNLTTGEATTIATWIKANLRDRRIPDRIPGGPAGAPEITRGKTLFRSRGCLSCHTTGESPGGAVGPDLAAVGDRLEPGYLWFHLKNPHAVNPQSTEPDYGLSDAEARALASYLVTRKK